MAAGSSSSSKQPSSRSREASDAWGSDWSEAAVSARARPGWGLPAEEARTGVRWESGRRPRGCPEAGRSTRAPRLGRRARAKVSRGAAAEEAARPREEERPMERAAPARRPRGAPASGGTAREPRPAPREGAEAPRAAARDGEAVGRRPEEAATARPPAASGDRTHLNIHMNIHEWLE